MNKRRKNKRVSPQGDKEKRVQEGNAKAGEESKVAYLMLSSECDLAHLINNLHGLCSSRFVSTVFFVHALAS